MSEQALCAEYGVDPDGPNAYEAADRIEQLLRYRAPVYLEHVSFRHTSAREFEFEEERRFAEQSEGWANERDLPQVARLAQQVVRHLEALARYSLRVAREVEEAVMSDVREAHDLRDWETRLQEGDFNPDEVIGTINRVAQSNTESGEIYAEALMESLYPFMATLVGDAQNRFDGNLGQALAARLHCPPRGAWIHYRGVSAYLWHEPDSDTLGESAQRVHIRPLAAPENAPYWQFPPATTQAEALALLRTEVDAFWRQNPPVAPDNNNAQ